MQNNSKIMILIGLAMIVLSLQITSCGSSNEIEIGPTVEHLAAIAVAATQEAQPTAELYPTATAYATFTAVPQNTALPTATNYPTYTPYPSATTYPTFTPEPTSTDTPTPIPQPTSEPLLDGSQSAENIEATVTDIQILRLGIDTRTKIDILGGQIAHAINSENRLDCQQIVNAYGIATNVIPEYDVSHLAPNYQSLYLAVKEATQLIAEGTQIGELVNQCRAHITNNNLIVEFEYSFLRRADSDLLEPRQKISIGIKDAGGE